MVSATSMFVSCKDYDDDVNNLQNQINNLDGTVKSSITTLQTSLTALEAAYKSGDDAVLAAANKNLADAKAALEAGLASTNSNVNALEIAVIQAQAGVDQALKLLDEKADKSEVNAVKADLAKVQSDLTKVQGDLQAAIAEITSMKNDVKAALAELSELSTAVNGQLAALETAAEGAEVVTSNIKDLQSRTAELERQVAILAGMDPAQPVDPDLSGINAELASLRQMVLDLSAKINDQPGSEFNTIIIALSKALRSLVFVPHLYLDGIESIEYPWIGDTILKPSNLATQWVDLSHHDSESGDKQDINFYSGATEKGWDYLPNLLGRQYNYTTKTIDAPRYVRSAADQDAAARIYWRQPSWPADEWIYGPAWEVEYHLNPSTALVDYANNAPSFNVLEPDAVYYNTRAKASELGVTSPEKFFKIWKTNSWRTGVAAPDEQVFRKDGTGIVYVGLQIANPDRLAPWPTDETINPNGNPDSNVSYPANQAGNNQPFAGDNTGDGITDKTAEAYPNYGSWYGWTRYGVRSGSNKKVDLKNTDNTIALQMHKTDDEEGMVTSDYALLVPTHVELEGLIWDKKPMYVEPKINGFAGGPGTRDGDEEGWALDENLNCMTKRIHVWDSPQEALADPDGAALELYAEDAAGLDLKPYFGIHYVRENLKKREVAPGIYNAMAYDIMTLHNGDEAAWGLHYEFELIDYLNSSNGTRDSRYASFTEWNANVATSAVVTDWNKTTSTNGIIVAQNVNAEGLTINERSTTSVDREPLVRVMVKNAKGDVLLDGYVLIHINYTPLNLAIDNYPTYDKEFNLCDPITNLTRWSEFSKYILSEKLQGRFVVDAAVDNAGMEILSFDDYYWADCKVDPAGTPVSVDDAKYVTQNAFAVTVPFAAPITATGDSHLRGYQLKLYNFGSDIYGLNGTPPARGYAAAETSNAFENKELGNAVYYPNGEGTTNHMFSWTLSEEEIEYLTHDKPEALTTGVKVERWFCFIAKDEVRGRNVNNFSAPYPYLWVKMTLNIKRDAIAYKYEEKIDNYWFNYQRGNENGWSGIVFDIQAPRDNQTIRNQRWLSLISSTMTADGVENHYKLTKTEGKSNYCKHSKYYFAPKEYQITTKTLINNYANADGLATYTITPRNGNTDTDNKRYREPSASGRNGFTIPAPIAGGVNDTYVNASEWDQMFCKFVYPHTYDNMYMINSEWWTHYDTPAHAGTGGVRATNNDADIRYINATDPQKPTALVNFLPNSANITASLDKHQWKESDLKKNLQECAIRYNDGVFTDTILYAKNEKTGEYTPIARLVSYEQDENGVNSTWRSAGTIELIHWLPLDATAADVEAGLAKENLVCYDVLNALGYPMKRDANGDVTGCDFDNAREFINKQMRAWVGVVANNGCDVAIYVEQAKHDEYVAAEDAAIEVNGLGENGEVKEDNWTPSGLTQYVAAPADPHKYTPIATFLTSWERPINLNQTPVKPALDANTNENIIYLLDYLKLFDWRGDYIHQGYMYDDPNDTRVENHWWFWGYYNVKGFKVDMRTSQIITNMHKNERPANKEWVTLNQVTTQAHLYAYPQMTNTEEYFGVGWNSLGQKVSGPLGAGVSYNPADEWMLYTYNSQAQEPAIEAYMGLNPRNETNLARFGAIYYENNGDNVTEFDVIIPITIFYEWGAQKYYTKWHIDTTHGRTN